MYNINEALKAAKILNIDFDKVSLDEFLDGLNIESEHGKIDFSTTVTDDDLVKTAKIALAHLNEFPNYYNKEYGLLMFENYLKSKINGK